jgi:hypothetical protein
VSLLVLGGLLFVGIVIEFVYSRREEAKDRARTTEFIVEIEAARITAAHSNDEDANAIILHDDQGNGVYINSHDLFEFDKEGQGYPTTWRLALTAREGRLVDYQTSGPLSGAQDEDEETEQPDNTEWEEVVVLDKLTPESYRWLMPRSGSSPFPH